MTKQELLEELRELQLEGDTEIAHIDADRLLVAYINDPDIYEAYGKIDKWYS